MLRAIRLGALALIVALAAGWAWVFAGGDAAGLATRLAQVFGAGMAVPSAGGGVQLPGGLALGGPFRLIDQTGRAVTEQDYAGRWLLLYFGYTYCPDVCPTELAAVAAATDLLGDAVTPVFITIDPERDTPAALADYVSRFHPRMVGLTGEPEAVAAAARAYRVYFARTRSAELTDYLMDHSGFVYLVGPDGRVRSLFRPATTPESIASATRPQLPRPG